MCAMSITLSEILAEHSAQAYLTPATLRLHRVGIASLGRTVGEVPTTAHLTDATLARHAAKRIADGDIDAKEMIVAGVEVAGVDGKKGVKAACAEAVERINKALGG